MVDQCVNVASRATLGEMQYCRLSSVRARYEHPFRYYGCTAGCASVGRPIMASLAEDTTRVYTAIVQVFWPRPTASHEKVLYLESGTPASVND